MELERLALHHSYLLQLNGHGQRRIRWVRAVVVVVVFRSVRLVIRRRSLYFLRVHAAVVGFFLYVAIIRLPRRVRL